MAYESRNEQILRATIDGTEYTDEPQSRIEALLLELKESIEAGGSAGGIDYSTEEQDTGLKWIDGKTIYQKVYTFNTMHSGYSIPLGFNVDTIIKMNGCVYTSTHEQWLNIPFYHNNAYQIRVYVIKDLSNGDYFYFEYDSTSSDVYNNGFIILQYTKPTT